VELVGTRDGVWIFVPNVRLAFWSFRHRTMLSMAQLHTDAAAATGADREVPVSDLLAGGDFTVGKRHRTGTGPGNSGMIPTTPALLTPSTEPLLARTGGVAVAHVAVHALTHELVALSPAGTVLVCAPDTRDADRATWKVTAAKLCVLSPFQRCTPPAGASAGGGGGAGGPGAGKVQQKGFAEPAPSAAAGGSHSTVDAFAVFRHAIVVFRGTACHVYSARTGAMIGDVTLPGGAAGRGMGASNLTRQLKTPSGECGCLFDCLFVCFCFRAIQYRAVALTRGEKKN
jgi:hypothetical protein